MKFFDGIDELNETVNKENIFSPPITSDEAVDFLTDYLLGEDWYSVNPISKKQINTEIVFEILMKHSRKFRKEYKQWRKEGADK